MQRKTLMVFGYGVLAGAVIDHLSNFGQALDIHVAGRDLESLRRRTNLSRYAAANFGNFPKIFEHKNDIYNVAATADLIHTLQPDVIFNATSPLPWWTLKELPPGLASRVDEASGGAWTPTDAVLPYKLAQALKLSGHVAVFVNGSYADVVNPALAAIGLAPNVGVGNVANAVPGLRYAIAECTGRPAGELDVRFVAHHFISYSMPTVGHTSGAPFHLHAAHDGQDIASEFDAGRVFELVATKFRRVKGLAGQAVTASSATHVLDAILNGGGTAGHAPGPMGLLGGYPVYLDEDGATLNLPEGLSAEEAEAINRKGQKWDGIEEIDANGNVHFTQKCQDIMKSVFGFDCAVMPIEECEQWAAELLTKYQDVNSRAA
ncbi:hypothetical protein [uncultured Roseibium sp.]|uniref:hypothetical protein n=1 Tax=uncultured Roseibium sp. TaxID=1936171 RepID=UPI002610EFD3|nr:hypothetical protein [uncultured Roseibium sp.]